MDKFDKLVDLQQVHKYNSVVICPNTNYNVPLYFDPSLNGHDFFSKTIGCSCLAIGGDKNHKCTGGEDGCRRTRKNEYARQQMKKYREKLKQDPVRYKKYLQSERERNAKRKLKKIQKLLSNDNSELSNEQLQKLQKRHQNLLYRARLRFGQEYLIDIKNTNSQSPNQQTEPSSINFEKYIDDLRNARNKTYENKKKKKIILKEKNEFNKKNNENKNNRMINDEELLNENLIETTSKSQNLEMPSLHFFSSIFNNDGQINNKTTVYEIGNGIGPFTNLKIINNNNNESNSKECIIPDVEFKQENISEIKEEIVSDPEEIVNNSLNQNYIDYNTNEDDDDDDDYDDDDDDSLSDTENPEDNDFKFNRICAIVNCPSRFMYKSDIKYYPFPPQIDIRECWFNLIKTKTKQWIIDPDAFICSLHFAPTWFQKSPSYGNKMLLLNAVPTIFPNGTASQFDLDIPLINSNDDYQNSEKFKNYYEWSCMKLREQENLLKEQQVIVENQSEYKIVQTKRIEKLYKIVDEFKKTLPSDTNDEILTDFLHKIYDIKNNLIS